MASKANVPRETLWNRETMTTERAMAADETAEEKTEPGGGTERREPEPTPLDAITRELLALRSMAHAFVAMIDAALTNARLVQLAEGGTDSTRGARTTPSAMAQVLDELRRQAGAAGVKKGPGRTFGDRGFAGRDDLLDTAGDTAGDIDPGVIST